VDVVGPDGRRSHVEREIDSDEAAIARRVFELTAAGYGRKRVAQTLNAEGAQAPRAQMGRPDGWCPSSIQAVLHRDLYRGVVVWNRSRKRNSWGQQQQKPRPETDWMRVEAPHLQIVSDALWQAAQARMARRRAVYFTRTDNQRHGRPVTGTISPYLLTGFVECGCCGGRMQIVTHLRKGQRRPSVGCYYHHTRGPRICRNRYYPSMLALETIILDAIEHDVPAPDIIEGAIAEALAMLDAPESADPRRRFWA